MKAIVRDRYGGPEVLRLEEIPIPTPADEEVLVRVRAASVNAGDRHMMRGRPFLVRFFEPGLLRPKSPGLGWDLAGTVEAAGPSVTRFAEGDEVFGCAAGAFAEFACVSETKLAPKPPGATFREAAAVPTAALTALQGLRDEGEVRPGMEVLVTGASGGVGSFAVQIARHLGGRVTGVARTEKLDLVRSLGADRVIDYRREDYTGEAARYDLILDAAAYRPLRRVRRALKSDGRYVMIGGPVIRMLELMLAAPLARLTGGPRMTMMMASVEADDLAFVGGLLRSGEIVPALDRSFPLAQVPEAIRYLEAGRARGKVVVSVGDGSARPDAA